jgi:hypothetical protein
MLGCGGSTLTQILMRPYDLLHRHLHFIDFSPLVVLDISIFLIQSVVTSPEKKIIELVLLNFVMMCTAVTSDLMQCL